MWHIIALHKMSEKYYPQLSNQQQLTDSGLSCQFYPDFFLSDNDRLFAELVTTLAWQQERLMMYGKLIDSPRLTVFYGDRGVSYKYTGAIQQAIGWTPLLAQLKTQVEKACGHQFNSVLANYYRDGNDGMGWHCDDERELGTQPVVASLSVGAMRDFYLRQKSHHQHKHRLTLPGGSLLVMSGDTQQYWQHSLPKRKRCVEGRVNLSFRYIHPST